MIDIMKEKFEELANNEDMVTKWKNVKTGEDMDMEVIRKNGFIGLVFNPDDNPILDAYNTKDDIEIFTRYNKGMKMIEQYNEELKGYLDGRGYLVDAKELRVWKVEEINGKLVKVREL